MKFRARASGLLSIAGLFFIAAAVAGGVRRASALDSSSAHFRNTRSAVDSGGSVSGSLSFHSADASGLVAASSMASAGFSSRVGLIPVYFYPGQVYGLAASSGPTAGTVYLQWVAPGDDGQASGSRAARYLVRVSSDPNSSPALSDAAFYASTAAAPNPPSPAAQGSGQTLVAANLLAGASYYFAIKATEADGLPGPLSAGVTAYASLAAPGVFSVTFTGISSAAFTLYWTSGTPGSGFNPAGSQYMAEVSSAPDFSSPIISAATSGLSAALAGLQANTTYYARAAAAGNAAASAFSGLGSTSTLAQPVQGAQIVCRLSASSATAVWVSPPVAPLSAAAEGFTFEASTASDFSGLVMVATTGAPGAASLSLSGLNPAATYYYRVGALNWNLVADYVTPTSAGVSVPTGLAGASGFKTAILSWNFLPQAGACAVTGYNLYRATGSPAAFQLVTNTVATTLTDAAVSVGTTYYYELTSKLPGGGESPASSPALVYVHSAPPLPPFGLHETNASATAFGFAWVPVTAYDNDVLFASYAAPAPAELTGYVVYRATAPLGAAWSPVATVSSTTWSWLDANSGPQYYYRLQAVNRTDSSDYSVSVGQEGGGLLAPDGQTSLMLTPAMLASLAGNGDPWTAYAVALSSHAEDITGSVFKSIEFDALKGGTRPDPTFQLASGAELQLHYDLNGSAVTAGRTFSAPAVPAAISAAGAAAEENGLAAAAAPPVSPSQLSVFWNNGSRWVQLYGTLDAATQQVGVNVRASGRYQLRSVDKPTSLNVDPSGVSNKFITPNGDGKNDNAVITFANPSCAQVTGKIFDLKGMKVADMAAGPINPAPGCAGSLMWDGKAAGRAVPTGVYVYQIQGDNKVFTGTLVVVK